MDEVEGEGHQIVALARRGGRRRRRARRRRAAGRASRRPTRAARSRSSSCAPAPRFTSPPASREPRRARARAADAQGVRAASRFRARRCSSSSTLARLAPNHHLTQPWRFRVLGPETLARLKECAGPAEAAKLDRAPTLVVASAALTGELVQDEEDVCATAAAIMLVLLAATERGLASYWRTPGVLRTARGREAVGIPAGERVLGLLHFGAAGARAGAARAEAASRRTSSSFRSALRDRPGASRIAAARRRGATLWSTLRRQGRRTPWKPPRPSASRAA